MKETVQANIGSVAFTLDDDAFLTLRRYLGEVRRHLPDADTETMDDIERRIAELLCERIASPMHVVSIAMVREAMARIGEPSDFGPGRTDTSAPSGEEPQPRRLCRPRGDRAIAGVCGGLARHFDVDATLLRIVMVLLILFAGLSIWAYVILWIVIPEEPEPRLFTPRNR